MTCYVTTSIIVVKSYRSSCAYQLDHTSLSPTENKQSAGLTLPESMAARAPEQTSADVGSPQKIDASLMYGQLLPDKWVYNNWVSCRLNQVAYMFMTNENSRDVSYWFKIRQYDI